MTDYRESLDRVLVHLFNDILRIEEDALQRDGVQGLSMREIHILQAISESGDDNTMSAVAARLHVTVGSLTVAVTTLVRKGYVQRQRSEADKRRIHLVLTDKSLEVERIHHAFHHEMTEELMRVLTSEQLDVICTGLNAVSDYFYHQEEKKDS